MVSSSSRGIIGKRRSKRSNHPMGYAPNMSSGSTLAYRRSKTGSRHTNLETILGESKTAIMDMDNNMTNWYGVASRLYNRSLSQRGLPKITESDVETRLKHFTPKKAFRSMGLSEKDSYIAAQEYDQNFVHEKNHYKPKRGAVELVHTLRNNHKQVAISTNSKRKYGKESVRVLTNAYNKKYNTSHLPHHLFKSIQYDAAKPSPKSYDRIMRKTKAKTAFVVGDESEDYAAASKASRGNKKVYSIGHLESVASSEEFNTMPDRLAPDLQTLSKQVQNHYKKREPVPVGQHNQVLSIANENKTVASEPKKGIEPGHYSTQLSGYREAA